MVVANPSQCSSPFSWLMFYLPSANQPAYNPSMMFGVFKPKKGDIPPKPRGTWFVLGLGALAAGVNFLWGYLMLTGWVPRYFR